MTTLKSNKTIQHTNTITGEPEKTLIVTEYSGGEIILKANNEVLFCVSPELALGITKELSLMLSEI